MKSIHFDKIGGSWKVNLLMILAFACISIGGLQLIDFENSKIYKYLFATGFIILSIYNTRMFFFKNYVQWNKRGALIKIDSFMGKSFTFDNITGTELNAKTLIITQNNGKVTTFDLTDITENDTQKLNEIINNSLAKTV